MAAGEKLIMRVQIVTRGMFGTSFSIASRGIMGGIVSSEALVIQALIDFKIPYVEYEFL